MPDTDIKLGDYVRDEISGFEGTVMVIGEHLTGCTRIKVVGGKYEDPHRPSEDEWFYPDQLTVLEEDVFEPSNDPVTAVEYELGHRVRDTVTGFEGIITVINYELLNCPQCAVQPTDGSDTTEREDLEWFDVTRLEPSQGESFTDDFDDLMKTDDTSTTGASMDEGSPTLEAPDGYT